MLITISSHTSNRLISTGLLTLAAQDMLLLLALVGLLMIGQVATAAVAGLRHAGERAGTA